MVNLKPQHVEQKYENCNVIFLHNLSVSELSDEGCVSPDVAAIPAKNLLVWS